MLYKMKNNNKCRNKKLEYIKANDVYFFQQKAGEQDPKKIEGCNKPVCNIKKLLFGRWEINYFDDFPYRSGQTHNENIPSHRLILYPSGIQEIKYVYEEF